LVLYLLLVEQQHGRDDKEHDSRDTYYNGRNEIGRFTLSGKQSECITGETNRIYFLDSRKYVENKKSDYHAEAKNQRTVEAAEQHTAEYQDSDHKFSEQPG